MPLPEHIAWLATNRGPALHACLQDNMVMCGLDEALCTMMAADPSPNKRAVEWLCDTYLEGGFRWEDLAGGQDSKVAETLRWFAQHRGRMQPAARNLAGYASLVSLYRALEPWLDIQAEPVHLGSARAQKREQRSMAHAQSLILYDSPELIVAVPLSREAAVWWGRGTRWCTAADSNNMFDEYNGQGPLIDIILPTMESRLPGQDKGKLQLHFGRHDDDIQFMDAADGDVSAEFIGQHWALLEGLMTWAVHHNGHMLRYIPRELYTPALCALAVQANGRALSLVPRDMRTTSICVAALRQDASCWQISWRTRQNTAIYAAAVQGNGLLLQQVPVAARSLQLCTMAVHNNVHALRHVPDEFKTSEFMLACAEHDGEALLYMDSSLRTRDVYITAIHKDPTILRYVPTGNMDKSMCLEAVQALGSALRWVPAELADTDVCTAAVLRDGGCLRHVPYPMRTADLCMQAVQSDGVALFAVPQSLHSHELYMAAVASRGIALRGVPTADKTHAMCQVAVENHPAALEFVPPTLCDQDMVELAFAADPSVFCVVAKAMRTPSMCRAAVMSDCHLIVYVPLEHRTMEIYVMACAQDRLLLEIVPEGLRKQVKEALSTASPTWRADAYFSDLKGYLDAHKAAPARGLDRMPMTHECIQMDGSISPAL